MKNLTRREFVVVGSMLAGSLAGGIALTGGLPSRGNAFSGKTDFPESSCGPKQAAVKKVLVAYASNCGSTAGVAEAVGEELCGEGASADTRNVGNVTDPGHYQAVIVASAIRMGRWLPEAVDFVRQHQEVLARVPVAYMVVCLTMKDDTPESRHKVLTYLDPLRKQTPLVNPVDVGLFAGVVDFKKLSFVNRSMLKMKGATEGDFRNWPAIRKWTADTRPALGV